MIEIDLPDECATEAGERVARLSHHKGLIRGEMAVGLGRDGQTIWTPRFWYPDGRLTPSRPTPYDLALDVPPEPEREIDPEYAEAERAHRTTAGRIRARERVAEIERGWGRTVDDFLSDGPDGDLF